MMTPAIFSDYQQLLDAICADAMIVARRVGRELKSARTDTSPLPVDEVTRTIAWITGIVCRAIAVSQHLAGQPSPAEEAAGRILPALETVLTRFTVAPLEHADYVRTVDAELIGEVAVAGNWEALDGRLAEATPGSIRTIPHRPPALLLGELCRDLGMVMREVPPAWLAKLSPDLRRFCDRAATAAIRPPAPHAPQAPQAQVGHLMER